MEFNTNIACYIDKIKEELKYDQDMLLVLGTKEEIIQARKCLKDVAK